MNPAGTPVPPHSRGAVAPGQATVPSLPAAGQHLPAAPSGHRLDTPSKPRHCRVPAKRSVAGGGPGAWCWLRSPLGRHSPHRPAAELSRDSETQRGPARSREQSRALMPCCTVSATPAPRVGSELRRPVEEGLLCGPRRGALGALGALWALDSGVWQGAGACRVSADFFQVPWGLAHGRDRCPAMSGCRARWAARAVATGAGAALHPQLGAGVPPPGAQASATFRGPPHPLRGGEAWWEELQDSSGRRPSQGRVLSTCSPSSAPQGSYPFGHNYFLKEKGRKGGRKGRLGKRVFIHF